MLKSLLAASDLSSRSRPALWRALQLAEAAQARVGVLHVVDDDQPEANMREQMRNAELELQAQVDACAVHTDCEVFARPGHAFQVICEEAHARDADLIVLGSHRRQFLRDVFIGTTTERVTRTAGRPLLMANGGTRERWKNVYIGVDMSETSAQAARTAHALGLLDGANVSFVHAYAPLTRQMMTYAGVAEKRIKEEAAREFQTTRQELARFIEGLGLSGVPHRTRIVEGLGASALAGVVEQGKADLLVIGTRGLSGVKRLFLGSVAQDLMSSLEIDVLAVPPLA